MDEGIRRPDRDLVGRKGPVDGEGPGSIVWVGLGFPVGESVGPRNGVGRLTRRKDPLGNTKRRDRGSKTSSGLFRNSTWKSLRDLPGRYNRKGTGNN